VIVVPKPSPRVRLNAHPAVESDPAIIHNRPLKVRRRCWYVLGIDVILNAAMEPVVLELNDRPSLMVTGPFEHDLKVKMLRDCFFHVDASGASHGDCPESGWQ
jgi:hypothetical protein